jgi:hypothetical protein
METINKYKTIAIVAIIGILVGRYVLQPKTKVETKEVIKYVEVYKEKKEEKKKKRTVITDRTNTDGSKETTTVISEDDSITTESSGSTRIESETTKIAKSGSDLSLSLLAIKDLPRPSRPLSYGVVISVPIAGNLNATGMVTTDKQIGLGIGITF